MCYNLSFIARPAIALGWDILCILLCVFLKLFRGYSIKKKKPPLENNNAPNDNTNQNNKTKQSKKEKDNYNKATKKKTMPRKMLPKRTTRPEI